MADLGVNVAKMSGRSLGFTGGTADKLEAIPGYNINLSIEEFKEMFSGINYTLEEVIRLNEIHTMLVICSWLPADTRV